MVVVQRVVADGFSPLALFDSNYGIEYLYTLVKGTPIHVTLHADKMQCKDYQINILLFCVYYGSVRQHYDDGYCFASAREREWWTLTRVINGVRSRDDFNVCCE
jgi:hypothetical protein